MNSVRVVDEYVGLSSPLNRIFSGQQYSGGSKSPSKQFLNSVF